MSDPIREFVTSDLIEVALLGAVTMFMLDISNPSQLVGTVVKVDNEEELVRLRMEYTSSPSSLKIENVEFFDEALSDFLSFNGSLKLLFQTISIFITYVDLECKILNA